MKVCTHTFVHTTDLVFDIVFSFVDMLENLSLDAGDPGSMFLIAESLFSDGDVNWGRVVSLAAFGVSVCQRCNANGLGDRSDVLGEEISQYLVTHQRTWLLEHNAWVCKYYYTALSQWLLLPGLMEYHFPRMASWTSLAQSPTIYSGPDSYASRDAWGLQHLHCCQLTDHMNTSPSVPIKNTPELCVLIHVYLFVAHVYHMV